MAVLRLWICRSIFTILPCFSYQSMLHSWIQLQVRHITDIPIKLPYLRNVYTHYINVIMSAMSSQLTGLAIVFSTVFYGTDQRKHQTSASLAGDRLIPRTKGQYRGKCSHLMTSSYTRSGSHLKSIIVLATCVLYAKSRIWLTNTQSLV